MLNPLLFFDQKTALSLPKMNQENKNPFNKRFSNHQNSAIFQLQANPLKGLKPFKGFSYFVFY